MRMSRSSSSAAKTEVVVLTADKSFESQARETFGASDQIVLRVVSGALSGLETELDMAGATVAVIDLDAAQQAEMQALDRLMDRIGTTPPVVAQNPPRPRSLPSCRRWAGQVSRHSRCKAP